MERGYVSFSLLPMNPKSKKSIKKKKKNLIFQKLKPIKCSFKMNKKKKYFQFFVKTQTKNSEKISKRKKLWKKFFYGNSDFHFFRTLLTIEFVIYSILPIFVKELFIFCFVNKIRETNCPRWVLKFLKIQEESIWGRFFISLFFFSFLEFKINLDNFYRNRTDLRIILNLNSNKLRKVEFWDKIEKILFEKNLKFIPFFKKKKKKKNFCFRVKSDINRPFKHNGKSGHNIHLIF